MSAEPSVAMPHIHGPRFVCLVGPSGAGKSTLLKAFLSRRLDYRRCLSVTTRAPRGGEVDGIDYYFITPEAFHERVAQGRFLEHAVVFGKACYGTDQATISNVLAHGHGVIKDVDIQGALLIKARMPSAVLVFVTPSAWTEIERRLRARATDDDTTIRRRLDESHHELAQAQSCTALVINDCLDHAVEDLLAIVRAQELALG